MSDRCETAGLLKDVENNHMHIHVKADLTERKDILAGNRSLSAVRRRLLVILLSAISVVCLTFENEAAAAHGQLCWIEEQQKRDCDYQHDPDVCVDCTAFFIPPSAFERFVSELQQQGIVECFDNNRCVMERGGSVIIFRPGSLE